MTQNVWYAYLYSFPSHNHHCSGAYQFYNPRSIIVIIIKDSNQDLVNNNNLEDSKLEPKLIGNNNIGNVWLEPTLIDNNNKTMHQTWIRTTK